MNDELREEKAKRILQDPLYIESFDIMKEDLMNQILEKQHPYI